MYKPEEKNKSISQYFQETISERESELQKDSDDTIVYRLSKKDKISREIFLKEKQRKMRDREKREYKELHRV